MLEKLFRWLNMATIILTLFSYISPYVSPSKIWFFSFFGTGYSWLLLFNVLFIVFWIVWKKWYFLFSLCCILLGWNHFTNFVGFHLPDESSTSSLSIMTYNIGGFIPYRDKKVAKKRDRAFNKMLNEETKPDVLCVQEVGWKELLLDYTYLKHHVRSEDVFIFSKQPFIDHGTIDLEASVVGCVWADLKIDNKKVRIYNIHLSSNMVTGDANKLRKEGNLQEKETWLGIKSMLGKYKRAAAKRATQAEKIANHIAKCPHPVIVVGDFNETPLSYSYRKLSTGLKDAFKEKAFGLGTSFAGSIPGLRIDYVLLDPSIKTTHHKVLKNVNHSDHYPILTKVKL